METASFILGQTEMALIIACIGAVIAILVWIIQKFV